MVQRNEIEIMKSWQGDLESPIVSVCCITYNHRNYISEALDSFLQQETNFPFEILVHDDASTDGTVSILQEYRQQYPGIIKLILQTENQYTKIPIISPRFVWPKARGKYIAVCEGDDYWTDENKLQKQFDFLEKNKEYSMYAHAVEIQNETIDKEPFYPTVEWNKSKNDFLDVLNNHFIPTPSIMLKNEIDDFPYAKNNYKNLRAGDMAIELFMLCKGFCYFDTKPMAVYRNHDRGITKQKISHLKIVKHFNSLYKIINTYSNYVYNQEITLKLEELNYSHLVNLTSDKKIIEAFNIFLISNIKTKVKFLKKVLKKVLKK